MQFPSSSRSSGESKSNLYVKLKSGDRIKGIFQGVPVIIERHWINKKPSPCLGEDSCPLCSQGDKRKVAARFNFLVQEQGIWMAKIFECSYGTYKDLGELNKDYPLEKTLVTISRQGEKTETRYTVLPCPQNLSQGELDLVARVPLNELKPGKPNNAPAQQAVYNAEQIMNDSDLPF